MKLLEAINLRKLQRHARDFVVDFKKGEAKMVKEVVMAELKAIMKRVGAANETYKGELKLVGSAKDGSKLYAPDEFDVNLVISPEGVKVLVEEDKNATGAKPREEIPVCRRDNTFEGYGLMQARARKKYVQSDDDGFEGDEPMKAKTRKKISVQSKENRFEGNRLMEGLYQAVKQDLAGNLLGDNRLSLVPPGITKTQVGVSLALAWQYNTEEKVTTEDNTEENEEVKKDEEAKNDEIEKNDEVKKDEEAKNDEGEKNDEKVKKDEEVKKDDTSNVEKDDNVNQENKVKAVKEKWTHKQRHPRPEKYPLLLIGVDLVPVLEVPWDEGIAKPDIEPFDSTNMFISNAEDGSWRCSFAQAETRVLKNLGDDSNPRTVQLMGKLILSNLKAEPWKPHHRKTFSEWFVMRPWKIPLPSGFCLKNAVIEWVSQNKGLKEGPVKGLKKGPMKSLNKKLWKSLIKKPVVGLNKGLVKGRNKEPVKSLKEPVIGLNEDPLEVLVSLFRRMCMIRPNKRGKLRRYASKVPAFFGGECESEKLGLGAPYIVRHLKDYLVRERGYPGMSEQEESSEDPEGREGPR